MKWTGRSRTGKYRSCREITVWARNSFSKKYHQKEFITLSHTLNKMTITRSRRHTLSACRRQSIRRIFPFWSGFDNMHTAGLCPVTQRTKSSRQWGCISFLNLPSNRPAHFCLISTRSFCKLKAWDRTRKNQISLRKWNIKEFNLPPHHFLNILVIRSPSFYTVVVSNSSAKTIWFPVPTSNEQGRFESQQN